MTGDELAIGDAIACQERESGQFGVLHIEPDQIWVEFVGFGKCPSINADEPIYLHTAKGWVVSLFDNIDVSSALPSWRRSDAGTVHSQRVISNLVLSGEPPWLPGDRALSVSFQLTPDCDFLWAPDLARKIAEVSLDNEPAPDRTILTAPVVGGCVSLAFAWGHDPVRNKYSPEDPRFTVRFDDGAEPGECLDRIWYLRALFALLSWRDLRSEGILIRRIGAEENSYSYRVLTAESKASNPMARAVRPIAVSVDDEDERAALRAVLQVWLDRQNQWEGATGMMCAALRRFHHVSAEQALDACRWHEAISKVVERPVRPAGMDEVVGAAIAEARKFKLDDHVGWITGRLSGIKGEPQQQFFTRRGRELNERLGHELFDDAGVAMLKGTYRVRNASAHGSNGTLSNHTKIRAHWGNVLAMEAFCAARTMADLPLSERGRHRLRMHPLFKAYLELRKERAAASASSGSRPK